MTKRKKRTWRILLLLLLILVIAPGIFVIWYSVDTRITPPEVDESIVNRMERVETGTNAYFVGKNWLRKNKYGLWEMYLEGAPFEMGVASGKLTKELIYNQEEAFVDKIREMVPSPSYLNFLKYFIGFFNRDIDEYILPEYEEEIYGISFSASDKFDFIGTNYERMLNYHGAHDIGHALQDLMLVGCTSFAANMGFSDSSLIIGRNFDFYLSEAFAKDKIVCFVNPERGHQFAYVTWASFIGVVSGMNNQGLTVTINAGKSDIPAKAATPISLLAREVLQYASNIEEAIAIAEKKYIFVAESLLIGSASDNRAVIIEKSPSKFGVFETSNQFVVCSNHFRSKSYSEDEANLKHKFGTASNYRQLRAEELIRANDTVNFLEAAEILRDRNGLNDKPIGIGNEKAMAQMISHHSVIFQPLKRNFWVSTEHFQLGEYLGYNLSHVFANPVMAANHGLFDSTLTIPADPFLCSEQFENFVLFKKVRKEILLATENKSPVDPEEIQSFVDLNPKYFQAYQIAGDYNFAVGKEDEALKFYKLTLTKEFEKTVQREEIEAKIEQLSNR